MKYKRKNIQKKNLRKDRNINKIRNIRSKLWKFKRHINSIEQDNLISEISTIMKIVEQPSLSIFQKSGNILRLNLTDNIRQKIYKILLNKLTPLCTSDEAFDKLIEEIRKKIKG